MVMDMYILWFQDLILMTQVSIVYSATQRAIQTFISETANPYVNDK